MNVRNEDECPICLVPFPLLITPCNHRACQTCLERVLFATQSLTSIGTIVGEENIATDEALEDFIVSNSPTYGRCPFCRKCISLFDLKIEGGEDNETKFIYDKRYDIWRTALSGMSFQDGMQNIILNFPNTDNDEPYVTITVDPNRDSNISFEKGHFFHEKTNMFHGTIDLSKGNHTTIQEKWDLVMQFASDFRFVIHGAIIKRPAGNIPDESLDELTAYPLAGVWVVRWQRSDQRGVDRNSLDAARLIVHGNSFYFQGFMYHINLGDEYEARVHFSWPSYVGSFKQVAESGINLQHNPNGPDVGETIVWNTTNPNFFRMFWVRIKSYVISFVITSLFHVSNSNFSHGCRPEKQKKIVFHPLECKDWVLWVPRLSNCNRNAN
jgi:Zinc finger, C3HC4 type (RING finger).